MYRDYSINHEIRIPINQPGFNGKEFFFFRGSSEACGGDSVMVRNLLSFSEDSVIYPATSEFRNGNRDLDQRFFSKLNDRF